MKLKLQQGRAPLISGRLCPVGRARGASVIQDWIEVRWPNLCDGHPFVLVTSPEFHRKIARPTETALQSKANTHNTQGNCVARQQSMAGHCDLAIISFGSSHSPTNSRSLSRTHIQTRGVRNNRAGLEFDQLHHEIRSLWFHTHNAVTKLLEVIAKQRFGEVVGKVILRP